jgi:hypothetical protein
MNFPWALNSLLASHGLASAFETPEPRSPDEYRQEVETYLSRLEDALLSIALTRHLKTPRCRLACRLENPTDRNIAGIKVTLTLPEGVRAYDDSLDEDDLPLAPRTWGPQPTIAPLGTWLGYPVQGPRLPFIQPRLNPSEPSATVGSDGHSIDYEMDLRPKDVLDLPQVTLLVPEVASSPLIAQWAATSTGARGVAEGTLEIVLAEPDPIEPYLPEVPRD